MARPTISRWHKRIQGRLPWQLLVVRCNFTEQLSLMSLEIVASGSSWKAFMRLGSLVVVQQVRICCIVLPAMLIVHRWPCSCSEASMVCPIFRRQWARAQVFSMYQRLIGQRLGLSSLLLRVLQVDAGLEIIVQQLWLHVPKWQSSCYEPSMAQVTFHRPLEAVPVFLMFQRVTGQPTGLNN